MIAGIGIVKHTDGDAAFQRAGSGDGGELLKYLFSIVCKGPSEICPRYCQRVPIVSGK